MAETRLGSHGVLRLAQQQEMSDVNGAGISDFKVSEKRVHHPPGLAMPYNNQQTRRNERLLGRQEIVFKFPTNFSSVYFPPLRHVRNVRWLSPSFSASPRKSRPDSIERWAYIRRAGIRGSPPPVACCLHCTNELHIPAVGQYTSLTRPRDLLDEWSLVRRLGR